MDVRALLELDEGRIPWAYADSLGYLTIGVGHLVDKRKGGKLPPAIIDALLDHDIEDAKNACRRLFPNFDNIGEVRQAVLISMAFNLGEAGLAKWPIFIGQITRHEFVKAAANMRGTLWATQVKARAARLARMMEIGEWPAA